VLALYCSHTVAACLYTLQALAALPSRTTYMPMMTLMSGALETFTRALETYVPSCAGRPARLFFMLEAYNPQGAVGHVTPPEPNSVGRRDLEPYDTWQRRSSPQPGGKVWSHRTRGSAGAHLSWEKRSEVTGHMAAPESTSA
jgi:hypothetical protein